MRPSVCFVTSPHLTHGLGSCFLLAALFTLAAHDLEQYFLCSSLVRLTLHSNLAHSRFKSERRGSNPQHLTWKDSTLPVELLSRCAYSIYSSIPARAVSNSFPLFAVRQPAAEGDVLTRPLCHALVGKRLCVQPLMDSIPVVHHEPVRIHNAIAVAIFGKQLAHSASTSGIRCPRRSSRLRAASFTAFLR